MSSEQTPHQNLRTFIAIDFPSDIIKEIARIQEIISKKPFTGKLIELENLHLTLKFLGEVNETLLTKTKQALSTIKFPTLNLQLNHVGTFNYKNKPKIVWIKVTGNIFALQKKIDESLKDLIPTEKRFMSHLTIARIKYVKDKLGFTDYISKIKLKKIKFQVNSFKLKSSDLQAQGPIYTTLKTYRPFQNFQNPK